MKITVSQLRRIIREEVENLSAMPYWEVVLRTFEKLRDEKISKGENGEVPLAELESRLGQPVKSWNGTGLRVINGVVTELLGDTPFRTDM